LTALISTVSPTEASCSEWACQISPFTLTCPSGRSGVITDAVVRTSVSIPTYAWLRERAGDELLEIRAHHLDHAASLLAELDGAPPAHLAREAASTLEEAGRRSLAREANQAARHLFLRAVELEPTLKRRYLAAKAAWRLDDLPAVAREMEAVRAEAVRIGDKNLEGRALTGLADMVLMREADPLRARELAEQALALIDEDPLARFDALRIAWHAAYWVGDLKGAECYVVAQLELARAAGRKDLENVAILTWADTYQARLDLETTRAKLEHSRDLAEKSGAINPRGRVYLAWGKLYLLQGDLEQAEEAFAEADRLFSEAGAVWAVARALNMGAWVSRESGDLAKAEKRFRESIRLLKPIGTALRSARASVASPSSCSFAAESRRPSASR
jgi:tetratricopeptide (TPR) repeat protein